MKAALASNPRLIYIKLLLVPLPPPTHCKEPYQPMQQPPWRILKRRGGVARPLTNTRRVPNHLELPAATAIFLHARLAPPPPPPLPIPGLPKHSGKIASNVTHLIQHPTRRHRREAKSPKRLGRIVLNIPPLIPDFRRRHRPETKLPNIESRGDPED